MAKYIIEVDVDETKVVNSSIFVEETIENFSEEDVISAINNEMSWVAQSGISVISVKKSE